MIRLKFKKNMLFSPKKEANRNYRKQEVNYTVIHCTQCEKRRPLAPMLGLYSHIS